MRFVLAVFAVWFAIVLVPERKTTGTYEQTIYLPHCEGGHDWYIESSDSDSVTVACYQPDPVGPDSDPDK